MLRFQALIGSRGLCRIGAQGGKTNSLRDQTLGSRLRCFRVQGLGLGGLTQSDLISDPSMDLNCAPLPGLGFSIPVSVTAYTS